VIKVEMHFLPDVYVPCDVCKGKRYNRETLEIKYKGKNIHQVLDMTVEDALDFFDAIPAIKRKVQTLMDVGLSYIKLGQSATTLSGGEAQRVKLARELSKRDTGKTLYILDEPTTGLHFYDIQQLLNVLHRLRDHGNTIVVIEHNLDVIKTADWIVDLGPEGGSGGGEILIAGTPEQVAACEKSYTGKYLKPMLG
jgi:excinuclease ABC subunit A